MTPHQNIESQIWEYIDGLSTPEERKFIEQLLATNAEWRAKYQELLEFNSSLADNIELEEPSMRFSRNVMEAIATHQIAPAAKTYINKKIIYGIAGFLLSLIAGFLIYAFAQIDWSSASGSRSSSFDLSRVDMSKVLSNNYINSFMIMNVVLGLMLLDRYLAQQRREWKKGDL